MRKKSHISLARYLVRELRLEKLTKHQKAFYLGSILPDLSPKMITAPHEYETSYGSLQELIRSIHADGENGLCSSRVIWRRIGVVMHYLADYFTFPHNISYEGSLKDHCLYEREMKHWMRQYVRTPEAMMLFRKQRAAVKGLESLEELFAGIESAHREYRLMKEQHTVKDDCRWIVAMCARVILYFAVVLEGECAGQTLPVWCAA